MIKRPALSLGITAIFLAGFIPWYLYSDIEPRSSTDSTSSKNQTHTSSIQPNIQHDQQVHKVIQEDSFNTQLAQELIDKYGDKIDHLAVQANLFKVRNFILERYPEDGMERFSDIINLAFPNQAESILKIVGLMNQYTQWLAENYIQLNDMSPLERDGHLWKKRRELFGHDADIIWSDERDLLAQKQRNVQQEIHRLGEANELSNDEKLYQLTTTLSENYGEAAQDMIIDPGMVAAVFFNFDSVQQSLEDLPAEERQVEINKVREQLGYNEEQIKEVVLSRKPDLNVIDLAEEIETYKNRIKLRMPLTLRISREFKENKEIIEIESIINNEREEVSPRFIKLKPQSFSL